MLVISLRMACKIKKNYGEHVIIICHCSDDLLKCIMTGAPSKKRFNMMLSSLTTDDY